MGSAELGGWIGVIGGSIGALIGILGGVIGTSYSIRNTHGPRERRFVIKASLACWAFVILFIAGAILLPSPHRLLLWIPYTIVLVLGIAAWNRIQTQLRRDERNERPTE